MDPKDERDAQILQRWTEFRQRYVDLGFKRASYDFRKLLAHSSASVFVDEPLVDPQVLALLVLDPDQAAEAFVLLRVLGIQKAVKFLQSAAPAR